MGLFWGRREERQAAVNGGLRSADVRQHRQERNQGRREAYRRKGVYALDPRFG